MCFVCPSWLSFILYNPIRKCLTDREKVMEESGITRESVVLEIGPGNGFFTEVLAERAKKVLAVELQAGMAGKLKRRVERFGEKVEVITADIATYDIGSEVADVCFLYYAFHEVSDKAKAAQNISKAVKKGGTLALYEPTVEVSKAAMAETVALFEGLGFKRELERGDLFTRSARLRKMENSERMR